MPSAKLLPKSTNPSARKPFTVRYWDDKGQHERSFRTAGEAREFRIKFEHDSREASFVDPRAGRVDFCEAVETWIARHPASTGTKRNYSAIYRTHLRPAFEGRTLAQVAQDRAAVQELLITTMPAKCCAGRVQLARQLILAVITEAIKAGKLGGHRLDGIETAPAGRSQREFIPATHAQVSAIAARAEAAGAGPGHLADARLRAAGLGSAGGQPPRPARRRPDAAGLRADHC